MKTFFLETFGCQMNEHDSSRIAAMLQQDLHLEPTDKAETADVVLINTCSVRAKPENKVYSRLSNLAILKSERKKNRDKAGLKIVIFGCMAQKEGQKLISKAPYIDLVVGTHNIRKIPEYLSQNQNGSIVDVSTEDLHSCFGLKIPSQSQLKAYLSIMEGCNNYCAYCVVPYTRGKERSRPSPDILEEARQFAELGVKEVTLLGQNVNSYGRELSEKIDFPSLLYKLENIEGIKRIRFVTSHPKDFSSDLIFAIRDCSKVCEMVHLPLQSGSDKILKLMNRMYSLEEYLKKIDVLTENVPNVTITTDLIVGFPEEEEKDFQATLSAVGKIQFDRAFCFKYSVREGTKAATYQETVTEQEKLRRLHELIKLQKEITARKNAEQVGKNLEILVDGVSKKDKKHQSGRTRGDRVVNFEAEKNLYGKFIQVKILEARANSLWGKLVEG